MTTSSSDAALPLNTVGAPQDDLEQSSPLENDSKLLPPPPPFSEKSTTTPPPTEPPLAQGDSKLTQAVVEEEPSTKDTTEDSTKDSSTVEVFSGLAHVLIGSPKGRPEGGACLFSRKCCIIIWTIIAFLFICGLVAIIAFVVIGHWSTTKTMAKKKQQGLDYKNPRTADHGLFCHCDNDKSCAGKLLIECVHEEECYHTAPFNQSQADQKSGKSGDVWKCRENPDKWSCFKNEHLQVYECWSRKTETSMETCACPHENYPELID